MATFHVFGIPVTIGLDSDLVEKYDRYSQLEEETRDDNASHVQDWEAHKKKISEQVDLFYELQAEGIDFGGEDDQVEETQSSSGNWFTRMFS